MNEKGLGYLRNKISENPHMRRLYNVGRLTAIAFALSGSVGGFIRTKDILTDPVGFWRCGPRCDLRETLLIGTLEGGYSIFGEVFDASTATKYRALESVAPALIIQAEATLNARTNPTPDATTIANVETAQAIISQATMTSSPGR